MDIKTIMNLNAQGVHLFSIGNHETAQQKFRLALKQLKTYANDFVSTTYHHSQGSSLQVIPTDSPQDEWTETPSGILFDQMFQVTFAKGVRPASKVSEDDVNLLATVVFFNMALSYHRTSLTATHGQSLAHRRAISLYEFAMSLTEKMESIIYDVGTVLLVVAMGNNLACLFADQFRHEELYGCVQWTQYHAEQQLLTVDTTFFWTNLMAWQDASRQAAAAA